MPFVPVVNDQPTNTPDYQGGNVPAMPDNGSARQLQQNGAELENQGLRQMNRAQVLQQHIQGQMDDANVNAAETKLIAAATDALHGENGYMNKQGADALNSIDSYKQALAKAKKDIQESLGNDVQKQMFDMRAQRHLVTIGGQMAVHQAQQRKEYTYGEQVAAVDTAVTMTQQAEIGSKDHELYSATAVKRTQDALAIRGIPADSEEAKKAVRDVTTRITSGDISRLMTDNKYTEAKTLLSEQIKAGNVEPEAAKQLRATIESNVERVENINTADKIFASRKGLDATDLEDMLGKVDSQVKDPEQRKQVRSLVAQQYSQAHAIEQAKYADNYSAVVEYKYSHHGSLKGVDPVQWGMLDSKDRYELSKPPAVETDINTLYSFITKPDTLTVDNVKTAWGKGLLSKESFISLTEHAMMLGKDKSYVQEAGDINGRIDYFANQAGIPVFSTGKDEAQKGQEAIDEVPYSERHRQGQAAE
jgi:hypothetical protein